MKAQKEVQVQLYSFFNLDAKWGWGKRFFCLPKRPDRPQGGPHSLLFGGHWGSFSELKRPEGDVDHSPPSGVEVKNEWSCTSTFFTRLHGADWYNVTFFTSILFRHHLNFKVLGAAGTVVFLLVLSANALAGVLRRVLVLSANALAGVLRRVFFICSQFSFPVNVIRK